MLGDSYRLGSLAIVVVCLDTIAGQDLLPEIVALHLEGGEVRIGRGGSRAGTFVHGGDGADAIHHVGNVDGDGSSGACGC